MEPPPPPSLVIPKTPCRNGLGFYPLLKCPLRTANPWVQHVCKHPSFPQILHEQKGDSTRPVPQNSNCRCLIGPQSPRRVKVLPQNMALETTFL